MSGTARLRFAGLPSTVDDDLRAEIGRGSTPRNGAGSIATEAAASPRPARIWASRSPNEWPISAGFLEDRGPAIPAARQQPEAVNEHDRRPSRGVGVLDLLPFVLGEGRHVASLSSWVQHRDQTPSSSLDPRASCQYHPARRKRAVRDATPGPTTREKPERDACRPSGEMETGGEGECDPSVRRHVEGDMPILERNRATVSAAKEPVARPEEAIAG